MRLSVRLSWLAVLGLAVAPLSCSFPTDKSADVFVVVVPSDSLATHGMLDRGGRDQVFARAYHRLANSDSVQLTNIAFTWSSSDKNIATVEGGTEGSAEVTGVNPGFAQITARAVPFEKALDGAATVRVADRFVIDSIRPLSIHYGDKLRFYGVRIQQLFGVNQGFGSLIPDFFSYNGSLEGLGYIDYWVPFPSTSARPFYIGPGFFGNAADSITVDSTDLFEPNYVTPTPIDINGAGGPRTFSGFPTLFFNPALYYEPYNPATDGPFAMDWYRFARTDTTQAVTYILNSEVFDDTAFAYFTDSAFYDPSILNYRIGGRWFVSPGNDFYHCDANSFSPFRESRTSSAILALKTLPAKQVELFSLYGKDGPYSLVVVRGYFTVDRRIGPDRFEENDNWCQYANENWNDPTKRIVVGVFTPFTDATLTIDNPNDIDWYKFRVTRLALGDTMLTIQTKSLPFTASDPSDIDLYVIDSATFSYLATSTKVGSTESLTVRVDSGVPYFLAVVDAAAQPTRYSICMRKGVLACPPPGAALQASIASSVYHIKSRTPGSPAALRDSRLRQFIKRP